MNVPADRPVLRDLPVASRLVIALFLISVGLGYFSALVQLHFQNASPGKLLPDPDDAAIIYHGRPPMSQLERVLVTDESKPFNGSGSMWPAFTGRSAGWRRAIDKLARAKKLVTKDGKPDLYKAESELRAQRDGERLALIEWIRSGASRKDYEEDSFLVSEKLAGRPITEAYLVKDANDEVVSPRRVMIRTILSDRCERCHSENVGGQAAQYPLDTFEEVQDYCQVETVGGGMSLKKLAQSTHVHLLGFSMLYGLTGLIFAFTSYPGWMRVLLAPFTLLAQIVDISCWWLARLDPFYAKLIVITGGAVGAGLFLQIVLSLFNMFGKAGKVVLLLLILAGCLAGYAVSGKVVTYLNTEGMTAAAPE